MKFNSSDTIWFEYDEVNFMFGIWKAFLAVNLIQVGWNVDLWLKFLLLLMIVCFTIIWDCSKEIGYRYLHKVFFVVFVFFCCGGLGSFSPSAASFFEKKIDLKFGFFEIFNLKKKNSHSTYVLNWMLLYLTTVVSCFLWKFKGGCFVCLFVVEGFCVFWFRWRVVVLYFLICIVLGG